MIAAVQQEGRPRQRMRSVADGPIFSVPALPLAAMPTVAVPAQPSCPLPAAPAASSAPASLELSAFLGRSVGSGQCVALVRAANPALGPTSTWTAGSVVQGNAALQPGTPIATFDPSLRYANATDGSSHAAIYLGQDARGLTVLDQWAGNSAAVRTIPWSHQGAALANSGGAYRVVQAG